MKTLALAFVAALAALAAATVSPATAQEATDATVTGAGSTFAYPLVARWSKNYQRYQSGAPQFTVGGGGLDDSPTAPALDYEPIGSLGGIMRARDRAVDFGASDAPLSSADPEKLGLAQFPIVIGGIVAVVNIDGVASGALRLSGETLADIFLGTVQSWSDPAIAAHNPGLKLPDGRINIVRRADGSGTTYNFTDYLSKVSPTFRARIGSDLIVNWPVGVGAKGNDGVAQTVRQTRNAIGYVDYAQALRAGLNPVALRNGAGKFVAPSPASFQAAASGADWAKAGDFQLLLTNAPGDDAYPIVATVFALMPKNGSARRTRATLGFFDWAFERGAQDAADLGYVPLPVTLTTQAKAYWWKSFKSGT